MLLDLLHIPIIQAPMLGASDTAMAIAVSKAGGLGSYAAAGSTPEKLKLDVEAIRASTSRPFAVNTFILPPCDPSPDVVREAIELLAPWRERYGLPPQAIPNQWAEAFEPQFSAVVESAPPVASFTFGILSRQQISMLHARNVIVFGTATSVSEAKAWADVGADAICAQGFEAGGHRGTFLKPITESSIGTFALVRTILAEVHLPIIAAGGIADGAGVAAALVLGASAVQVGTAYLLSDESIANETWRAAIQSAPDDPTRLTRAISGRYARGIENEFMTTMRAVEEGIAAYPVQNALTQELRSAAAKAGSSAVLSMWAGQAARLTRQGSSGDITRDLWNDARRTLAAHAKRWAVGVEDV